MSTNTTSQELVDENLNSDSNEKVNVSRVRRESGEFSEPTTELSMNSQEYPDNYSENRIENFVKTLLKLNMVPVDNTGKFSTDALEKLLNDIKIMKNDHDNYYAYTNNDENQTVRSKSNYQTNKPFLSELLGEGQSDSRLIGQTTDPPYKYQQYANEDESVSMRTRVMKSLLNWMKDSVIDTQRNHQNQLNLS